MDRLKEELAATTARLGSLQGKAETFSVTVTDKFLEIQPILQNMSRHLHQLSKNSSLFQSSTAQALLDLEQTVSTQEQQQSQVTTSLGRQLTRQTEQLDQQAKQISRALLAETEKLQKSNQKLKTQTLSAISTLNVGIETVENKIDEDRANLATLNNFKSDVKENLDKIKLEINKSVDVLTRAMDKNVTESLAGVKSRVSRLEEEQGGVGDRVTVLAGQTTALQTDLAKLQRHTQRSVDTSAGIRANLIALEGE